MQLEYYYSVSKKQPRKLIERKLNRRKKWIKYFFSPRKLNILNDLIIIISYFLKALLCKRINWVNYYKLE